MEDNRIFENENTENIEDEIIEAENVEADELSFDDADLSESTTEVASPKKSWAQELYEWVSSIAVAIVLALVINTFVFSLVQVDGQSMVPTLEHGERLVVGKMFYKPEAKDIVIIKSGVLEKYIVKRVIALPGDTVDNDVFMEIYVNGEQIDEPYINEVQTGMGGMYNYPLTVPKKGNIADLSLIEAEVNSSFGFEHDKRMVYENGDIFVYGSELVSDGKFVVGETRYKQDCYFVMGDNRNNSSDSRSLGVIPADEIVGKAVFRFLPFNRIGTLK